MNVLQHTRNERNLFFKPDRPVRFYRDCLLSAKFSPDTCTVGYSACKLGHNTLENMLRNMTTRAGVSPYLTKHSMRATAVTVLWSNNIETRRIKAVTGHRDDTSIQSYCERPTLGQFKDMSSALSSFVEGKKKRLKTGNYGSSRRLWQCFSPKTELPQFSTREFSYRKWL